MIITNYSATKLLLGICLTSSVLLFSQCKKDEPLQKKETSQNQNLIGVSALPGENRIAATTAPAGAYNVQNSLPSGYVKDGSKDYTAYLQKAIDSYSEIVFPGFPIQVSSIGLKIKSNKRITFLNGSEIRLKPTSTSTYNIIDIRGASNITLVDPVIVGDRNNHLGTGGEAGVGIGIRRSTNIVLTNPVVSNCWGDGIYIGTDSYDISSKNISITNGSARNNRRDGLSVISVDGLTIDNFYAGFNKGTLPECGIDFEPNNPKDDLKNIVLNNVTTEGNGTYGIMISLSRIFGGGNKNVDITINNHNDKQSFKAMKFSAYTTYKAGSEVISTNVVFNNPKWKQDPLTASKMIAIALFEQAQKLTIKNPTVYSPTGSTLSQSTCTTVLKSLFNRGSNVILTYVDEPTSEPTPTPTPTPTTNTVVFAVNAGGSGFTASNGISYLSDRNFTGGYTYKTSSSISNTSDDALYQSERYGKFSYAIPVSDGTYEVTLKLAELYQAASGRRQFDIRFEGIEQVSNLDLFAVTGKNNAYDLVKTVTVTDGTLNILFNTDIDNAKVSAFHVIKK
ncbi:MAG: hypothetical protein H7Y07_16880 [Pyrinomonadaceae bacterium]|nr:hypothetical protein [Sphingobacteriaceae bacterium]